VSVTDPKLITAITNLIEGVKLIGDAATTIITIALASLGVQLPEVAIRTATIILVVLSLWKFSGAISKVVLYALIFLLVSMLAGLIPSLSLLDL